MPDLSKGSQRVLEDLHDEDPQVPRATLECIQGHGEELAPRLGLFHVGNGPEDLGKQAASLFAMLLAARAQVVAILILDIVVDGAKPTPVDPVLRAPALPLGPETQMPRRHGRVLLMLTAAEASVSHFRVSTHLGYYSLSLE